MGGAVPASVWPRATEIFQEGLRLRPTRLYRAGALNEDVRNVILDNCRIPEMNWGDIMAMCAAVNSCDRRVQEMVRKFGVATVVEGIDAVLDYAEQRARAALAKIPDGTYRFADHGGPSRRCRSGSGRASRSQALGPPRLHGLRPPGGLGAEHRLPRGHAPVPLPGDQRHIVSEDPEILKASSILRPCG
jgi:hypothetical protein